MIFFLYVLWHTITQFSCIFYEHDLFEWVGLVCSLAGVWCAFFEIRKSRKATELSNKQCLFERRLKCYFIHNRLFAEINNNWSSLQQIVESKKEKRGGNINIAFQLFVGTPITSDYFVNNEEIFELLGCYNSKVTKIEMIPEESRIVFGHLELTDDAGAFIEKYINMLYNLHLARQFYGGNAASEEIKNEIYNKLSNSIDELDTARRSEQCILNRMKDELNLERN